MMGIARALGPPLDVTREEGGSGDGFETVGRGDSLISLRPSSQFSPTDVQPLASTFATHRPCTLVLFNRLLPSQRNSATHPSTSHLVSFSPRLDSIQL